MTELTTIEITKEVAEQLTTSAWYENTRLGAAEKEQLQELGEQYQLLQAAADYGLGELLKKAQHIAGNEFQSWAQSVLGLTPLDTKRIIESAERQALNQQMLEMKQSGMTYAQVGEAVNLPLTTVEKRLKASNDLLFSQSGENTTNAPCLDSRVKLQEEDEANIADMRRSGESLTAIAHSYGIDPARVSNTLSAAGLSKPRSKTLERDERILELRAAGLTQAQIAKELGCSQQVVSLRLKAAKTRTPSQPSEGKSPTATEDMGPKCRLTEEDCARLAEWREQGLTLQAIGDRLGVHPSTVRLYLKRLNGELPSSRSPLTNEQVVTALELRQQGLNNVQISKELGVDPSSVGDALMKKLTSGVNVSDYIEDKPVAGGRSVTPGQARTPPLSLFMEEGHELNLQMEHYKKRFIGPLLRSLAEIDLICQRMDTIHNMLMDDHQHSLINMRIRWVAYERLWRTELQDQLQCDDFNAINQRFQNAVKRVERKVRYAMEDLRFDRSGIQVTP